MSAEPVDSSNDQNQVEQPCSECGVGVRVGVVRCWNCGAFMEEHVEKIYQEMQTQPRPIIYSRDQGDAPESDWKDPSVARVEQPSSDNDVEDDFELSEDVAFYAEDDDFELSDDINQSVESAAQFSEMEQAEKEVQDRAQQQEDESSAGQSESSYQLAKPEESSTSAAQQQHAPADRPKATEDVPEVDHSVATGGEALWEIAKTEKETKSRSKKSRKEVKVRPGSVLVYCPNGHRIVVQERHRGKLGRCPKCKATFTVPMIASSKPKGETGVETEEQTTQQLPQHFAGMHLHSVDPTKLKLKEGSLSKAFEEIDVCLAEDGMLIVTLVKKGLFGGGKEDDVRKELVEYLTLEQKLKNAPGETKHVFDPEELSTMATVFPTAYSHESIFGGINVFGPGRIAVRLPKREDNKIEFLSMTLSVFRRFRDQLQERCGFELSYEEDQIPVQDKITPSLCHYTDQPVKYLENLSFYEADPEIELDLVGWKCQACGLTVSEDGRKKENIGGKNAKSIAKAKCPKCTNAFGKNPLYALKQPEAVAVTEDGEADS